MSDLLPGQCPTCRRDLDQAPDSQRCTTREVHDNPDAVDREEIEREVRAKIRAEVIAARERWAPGPDHASAYRRGINLALLVIDGHLDRPLWSPR